LKKSRRRRRSPDLLFPTVIFDLPTKGSPENQQKYFQKLTFFKPQKTTTPITTKNHQLTTFSPQKPSKKRTKTRNPPVKTGGSPRQKIPTKTLQSQLKVRAFPSCGIKGSSLLSTNLVEQSASDSNKNSGQSNENKTFTGR
jgi:hypothetical protein